MILRSEVNQGIWSAAQALMLRSLAGVEVSYRAFAKGAIKK